METDGAWIFLSHSHKDLDSVMRLRNVLERYGHHPLMFFLKCLDDDSELDDLVKREIAARRWFVLCDSPNSQASRWVRREIEIINTLPENQRRTVDLTIPQTEDQVKALDDLLRRATVFISYAHRDEDVATAISQVLRRHDFAVWDAKEELKPAMTWVPVIESAIANAAQHGFVLVLINKWSRGSAWVERETQRALEYGSKNVIPIALEWPPLLPAGSPLAEKRILDFSKGTIRENTENLIEELMRRPIH